MNALGICRYGRLLGSLALGATLCSCMSVKYDMRKLNQPVTMNKNPFACGADCRPALEPVDRFSASVSELVAATSSGGGGGSSQSTSTAAGNNDVQVKAFQKIGGDNSKTINGVALNTESMGLNLLFGLMSAVKIEASGTVNHIPDPVTVAVESKP